MYTFLQLRRLQIMCLLPFIGKIFRVLSIFSLLLTVASLEMDKKIEFDENSDPYLLAKDGCINEYESCMIMAEKSIERYQARMYNKELIGWRFNKYCDCSLPKRDEKLEVIQFLHIPKTGTSLNWFFRDYFGNCTDDINSESGDFSSEEPCVKWLSNVSRFGDINTSTYLKKITTVLLDFVRCNIGR